MNKKPPNKQKTSDKKKPKQPTNQIKTKKPNQNKEKKKGEQELFAFSGCLYSPSVNMGGHLTLKSELVISQILSFCASGTL